MKSEAEADEAIDAGADVIMLDNMEGSELVDVARRLKEKWLGKRRFQQNWGHHPLRIRAIKGVGK